MCKVKNLDVKVYFENDNNGFIVKNGKYYM